MKKSEFAARLLETVYEYAEESGNLKLSNQDLSDIGETLYDVSMVFGQAFMLSKVTGRLGMDISTLKESMGSEEGKKTLSLLDLTEEQKADFVRKEMEKRVKEHMSVTNKTFSD